MGYVCSRVEVFPKVGEGWSTIGTELVEARNVTVNKGIGKIKNTFSFTLNKGASYFDLVPCPLLPESLVKIWIWRDSTSYTDADLQIQGTIRGVPQTISDSGDVLQIQGNDFTEIFFDNMIPINYKQLNWVNMIQNMINWLRNKTNKPIYWATNGVDGWTGTSNPTVKSDGSTSFPLKDLVINYTRVSEILEKLSSDEFTGDGQYIYYLQQQWVGSEVRFYLVTKFKGTTMSGVTLTGETLASTITEGNNSFSTALDLNKDDAVNFVIYNCGYDLRGNVVEKVEYDTSSIGKVGFKTAYPTEDTQNFFDNLHNLERSKHVSASTLYNYDAEGNPTLDFPDAYDYTFYIDGTVVSNDNEYNEHLRSLALTQGKQFAIRLIQNSANPRYTLKYNSRFTNDFIPGSQWNCNFPSRNINKPLRIEDMSLSITGISLSLIEDEKNSTGNI